MGEGSPPAPARSASPHGAPSGAEEVGAVLFDAGNTLVYVDPARMAEILGTEGVEATPEDVVRAERKARRVLHDAIRWGGTGTEPEVWREYFLRLFRGSGVPDELLEAVGDRMKAAHARRHLWTYVAPGTADALQALRDAGYPLGVISNADGRVETLLEDVGLRGYFDFVVDSEVLGVEKPDRRIFQEGCRRMGLPPGACLYVGDLYPVDYLGATGAGLQAVLLDSLGLHDGRAPTVASLAELGPMLRMAGI
ncbi:MAG: HAD family hydrolase [Gemmatimonadota bacterium]